MLGDAVNAKKADGTAKDTLQVIDVAQLLLTSANPPPIPTEAALGAAGGQAAVEA
jgi:hypothetical protein